MAIFIKIKNQQQILQRLKSENEVEPQTPKKTSHKQTSASEGKQYTLVFNLLAAMVIAQTSVQQQHINPSWPSILTCDKRGGREGGGREGGGGGPPPLRHAALSSTRAPAGPREPTVIRRALFLEMQGVEGAGGGPEKAKEEEEHWAWKIMYGQGWRLMGTGWREGRGRSDAFNQMARRASWFWGFCLSFIQVKKGWGKWYW